MDVLDKIELLQDLDGKTLCDLNHGKGYSDSDIIAVDYVVLPMGMVKDNNVSEHLVMAVCPYCIESMYDREWVLLCCLACGQTRWIWRRYSKLQYINAKTGQPYDILLLDGCPDCSGTFNGVYYYHHQQFMKQDGNN